MDVGCSAKGSPSATVGAEHLALFTLSSGSTHLVNGAAYRQSHSHTTRIHPACRGVLLFPASLSLLPFGAELCKKRQGQSAASCCCAKARKSTTSVGRTGCRRLVCHEERRT